jgi:hypothetical protein
MTWLLIRHDEVSTSSCPVLTLSLWERVGGEAGVSDGMPSACVTVSACKRIRALQVWGSGTSFIRSGSIAKSLFCLALLPGWSQAQIFTCKDASGRMLSADRPIPECANRPMREMSRDGWVRREIQAPLTAEQKRQLQLLDEQRKAQDAALEEQRQFDRVLMMRYGSEASIETARRREVLLLEEKLQESTRLITDAERRSVEVRAETELHKKNNPLPAGLLQKRDLAEQAIRTEKQNITHLEAAIVQTNVRYDATLKRFRELTAPNTAADKKR